MNPWRAGTPGRAPRNWRAVVEYWRPLRLFIYLTCLLTAAPAPADAQLKQPTSPVIKLRVGAFYATPLVRDAVGSTALDDSIPGTRSDEITLQQKISPIGTLAVVFPLRSKAQIELNASIARSRISGDDGLQQWDAANATVANTMVSLGYLYRGFAVLHAGVGLTRIYAEERGLFSKGNSIKPILEAGVATSFNMAGRPIELNGRVQSHSFGTATLRDNGGSDGGVLRFVLQLGTVLWQVAK